MSVTCPTCPCPAGPPGPSTLPAGSSGPRPRPLGLAAPRPNPSSLTPGHAVVSVPGRTVLARRRSSPGPGGVGQGVPILRPV